jgi:hypothetical protein
MYDALNHGARRVCAGRWRRCRCPGPGRAGRIVLAVDVTPRCARTLHPAQTGCFATSTAAGRGQAQSIPGWLYSFVAAIEPGWTSWSALLDAIRLDRDHGGADGERGVQQRRGAGRRRHYRRAGEQPVE